MPRPPRLAQMQMAVDRAALVPSTNQPDWYRLARSKPMPRSHARCRMPLAKWYVKGKVAVAEQRRMKYRRQWRTFATIGDICRSEISHNVDSNLFSQ